MKITVSEVTKANWHDLEALFESKGSPHYCWCMKWRPNPLSHRIMNKAQKKQALKHYVDRDVPIGIIGYEEGIPISWCSIAPRETCKALWGETKLEKVWTVACFFVKRPYRGKGITETLLHAAIEYAKKQGANYVEATPADSDSPSYGFMGRIPLLEKAGFQIIGKAGTRRHYMLLDIRP
ncbi:MAG: hypothetical protein B6D68_01935 [spirochete symbiont of Stewartia floridana]|nr:MAG: hypothetical protein B6D68_01935 [spirochete symbiont of Stewartia floridana]